MAKKMRLDFSKVEERSGWNTRSIPEGLHKMRIESVQETEAGDGTAMLVYALVPEASAFKSRRFPFYCKIQQNQLWKLRDLLVAAGVSVPKKAVSIDPASVVGKFIAAEVEEETGQYAGRSSVQSTYGLDILDEDGSIASDEDDEDETDDEAEEADVDEDDDTEDEDEDDEEDDEEEDEDLTELSLPELRKRAKSNDIDTAGLKKAELIEAILEAEAEDDEEDEEDEDELDEDDLGDDELPEDDEDEEEEEEEPAPAPRKRPAAKKAPAKAAPAKRVVKRR
jgi:hypothetical protein